MEIDVALARRLVDSQFPQWSHLPIAPVADDGWDNRTFRLGSELSVRLPSGDWYAEQVSKEQRWLPLLAPQLPLPIPAPVGMGEPAAGYPYRWSVYRWLDGEIAARARIADMTAFASALAGFLNALARADAAGGPPPRAPQLLPRRPARDLRGRDARGDRGARQRDPARPPSSASGRTR